MERLIHLGKEKDQALQMLCNSMQCIGHLSQEHGDATTWVAKCLRGAFPCEILVEMNNNSGMHGIQLEVLMEVTSTITIFWSTGYSYSLQHRRIRLWTETHRHAPWYCRAWRDTSHKKLAIISQHSRLSKEGVYEYMNIGVREPLVLMNRGLDLYVEGWSVTY